MQETKETQVRFLGWEDPLEKEMATHSSILAWRIPWTEEPGRLQSMGLLGVGHDWSNLAAELSGCILPSQPRNQITGLRTSNFDTLFPQSERSAEQLIGPSFQLRGENLDQGTWAGRAALSYPNLSRVHLKESPLGPIPTKTSCRIQRPKHKWKGIRIWWTQRLKPGLSRAALDVWGWKPGGLQSMAL